MQNIKKIRLLTIICLLIIPYVFSDISEQNTFTKKLETPADYSNEIPKKGIVIVKFFATWCPPCRAYATTFTRVANSEHFSTIKFIESDIDQFPNLTKQFGVSSIPNTTIVKDDKKIASKVGPLNEAELKKFINENTK